MMKHPHLICIGVQRASTTKLFSCLQAHPQVVLPIDKEVHYFNAVSPVYKGITPARPNLALRLALKVALSATDRLAKSVGGRRLYRKRLLRGRSVPEYYESLFCFERPEQKISCDITPAYALLSEAGIREMQATAPGAKILFILRDPVERMWSEISYYEKKRYGATYLEQHAADLDPQAFMTPHHHRRAAYADILDLFGRHFSDIKVMVYEDLNRRPRESMADLCRFMGIDDGSAVLDAMPLEERVNQVDDKAPIPRHLEEAWLAFHADNYRAALARFGKGIASWRYADRFMEEGARQPGP